jgi:hypothetical protein
MEAVGLEFKVLWYDRNTLELQEFLQALSVLDGGSRSGI